MKRKNIFITLLITLIALFTFTKVEAAENILSSEGQWGHEFGTSWTGADGTFSSSSERSFKVNLTSIGDNRGTEWGAQAYIKNKEANLVGGYDYLFSGDITSDKDRTILAKIEDDQGHVYFEKWITLKANEKTSFSGTFMSKYNKDKISIYFAYGYNSSHENTSNQNIANTITVDNLNLSRTKIDYSNKKFTEVQKGDATVDTSKYSHYKVFQGSDIISQKIPTAGYTHKIPDNTTASTDKNALYFPLSKPVTNVRLNNKLVDYYTNTGALAFVPLDLFKNEYNEIIFYNEDEVIAKIIIKNKDVTDAKVEAETKVDSYLPQNASDKVKEIVAKAKDDINKAQNIDEINSILNSLPNKIALQQAKEKALEELKTIVGSNYSDKVKELYNKAVTDINNATTKEEVTKILEAAKKDIVNQVNKEKQKNVKNPLTLDNILIYLIILGGSFITFNILIKKYRS